MKRLPRFRNEEAERRFWENHSPLDFMDSKKLRLTAFPNLKPTSRTISIRLPESLIEGIKALANQRDIPYQSMMKVLLTEKVREELVSSAKRVAAGH